jgi:hypothetical protein
MVVNKIAENVFGTSGLDMSDSSARCDLLRTIFCRDYMLDHTADSTNRQKLSIKIYGRVVRMASVLLNLPTSSGCWLNFSGFSSDYYGLCPGLSWELSISFKTWTSLYLYSLSCSALSPWYLGWRCVHFLCWILFSRQIASSTSVNDMETGDHGKYVYSCYLVSWSSWVASRQEWSLQLEYDLSSSSARVTAYSLFVARF